MSAFDKPTFSLSIPSHQVWPLCPHSHHHESTPLLLTTPPSTPLVSCACRSFDPQPALVSSSSHQRSPDLRERHTAVDTRTVHTTARFTCDAGCAHPNLANGKSRTDHVTCDHTTLFPRCLRFFLPHKFSQYHDLQTPKTYFIYRAWCCSHHVHADYSLPNL